jgi:hypothetical protein
MKKMFSDVDLEFQGYRSGPPSKQAEEIDSAIAERMPCPKCGARMRYRGFHRSYGGHCSYIALAVCVRCGHQIEF